jgi:hypothetical protein
MDASHTRPTFVCTGARHDKIVELVTRMTELKRQQARAPKKQSPSQKQLLDQKLAITDGQIDRLVYELCGLSDDEMRVVEDADGRRLTADGRKTVESGR